ncbi:dialkylrecorsinol condensing enzyme DarA [Capnocytophaga catalasegens]|uniref:Dialkylrecorsinol condensing protein DarA n=1 Tax=Capnocytophaga catalasegens TaxID=1004260 RepID=A0AAV5AW26_9FLAO|nr:dialkylrecorsinol condensing enzyme DarA [Capnocytophaga catalasegens]GIZ15660.1 dialkylrecorsinol condensing protein DarA [Capnocytophaga catalasegens]GJM49555.1 dialkylrecorsinol condensing protein DarA [Capnocytophaga catalasegens]GJM51736.1 dialkylrecorsinol condensing protein DarA [Capnocytophaga catalasegens]
MKKILVIYYTQTGQLKEIVDRVVAPLQVNSSISIDYYQILMEKEYPFPWSSESFFGAFPESFLQIAQPIVPVASDIVSTNYDLIILAYQVWFLSPSIPITSFLKSLEAKKILAQKPVLTISGTRNMWVMAQQKIKTLLSQNQATLIGNIALTDPHINHISVITIVHWMFSGKKTKYLGIFPRPGVSEKDIQEAGKFGEVLLPHLVSNHYEGLQDKIIANKGVQTNPFLISADKKANHIFHFWAKNAYQSSYRKQWLKGFHLYLYFAIWILMPIVYIFHLLTYPLFYRRFKKEYKNRLGI